MSKARMFWALLLLSAAPVAVAAQQQGAIQGTVVDATNLQPIAGAQVVIPALNTGTLTNAQGRFQIVGVPAGPRLVRVSVIGYAGVDRSVDVPTSGTATLEFVIQPSALTLEGVVVTALGMERQARALGVAAQQVASDEISRIEPNLVSALSGKVAGVQIRSSSVQGGSARIVIRGASSISGNNQPLFVIDGIPIDNSSPRLVGFGGIDYGNAAQDLDPESIESLTVLKGPNAAALYGSRAQNGAIVITTKSGRDAEGGQITASQTLTWEEPLRLPEYQNQFGQGQEGRFRFWDGFGGGVFDDWDESWGPQLDGRLVAQYTSPVDPATGERVSQPWVAHPNNVRNFFDTGRTSVTSAAFAAATESANARISVSRQKVDGMVPAHELEQLTLGFSGGVQATDRLRVETTGQYITSQGAQRPEVGYAQANPMGQFLWWGRQIDMSDLRANYLERRPEGDPQAGRPFSWNYRYWPNPFYIQNLNDNSDTRNRLIGQITADYQLLPWLGATLRTGTDLYQDDRFFGFAQDLFGDRAGFDPRFGAGTQTVGSNGAFGELNIGFQETSADFLLTANPQLNSSFSLNTTVGASRRDKERDQRYIWIPDLTAPGVYSVTNVRGTPDPWDSLERRRMNSVLGMAELGYNNYLFLTVTGRNDWSSTLPEENRSFFYPSVSGSFVFSDVIRGLDRSLDFGKLRASWTRVGNDADPYSLRNTFRAETPFEGLPRFTEPNTLANPNLRPERTEAWEVGTELGLLNGRMGLDLTYYSGRTFDQIFPVQISRGSGYTGQYVNAGSVQNRGVEALVSVVPVRTSNLAWETSFTFGLNRNKVVELAEGVEGIQLPGSSFMWAQVWAREGEPYGVIRGTTYRRNGAGEIVVNASGIPMAGPIDVLGNYNPDWTAGWSNTLRLGNFSLNFLIDRQQGGDLYSASHAFGMHSGVLAQTVEGRCRRSTWSTSEIGIQSDGSPAEAMPLCSEETGLIVPGVKIVSVAGADTTFAENDIVVDAQSRWHYQYIIAEQSIFDATYTKLRELSLSYQVPGRFTERLRLGGMTLGLVGRNLLLWADAPHIDPETTFDASNVQGFESGQMPTPRSIGLTVSVRP